MWPLPVRPSAGLETLVRPTEAAGRSAAAQPNERPDADAPPGRPRAPGAARPPGGRCGEAPLPQPGARSRRPLPPAATGAGARLGRYFSARWCAMCQAKETVLPMCRPVNLDG